MIEALTLLLSSVTLALQRRDRAKEAASFDEDQLHDELLNLHSEASEWLGNARATNQRVRWWITEDMPSEVPRGFHSIIVSNSGSMAGMSIRLKENKGVLPKVLAVYAPKVANDLNDVLSRRQPIVDRLSRELQVVQAAGPAEAERLALILEEQVRDLEAAVEQLGEFIRNMRPLP